MTPHAWFRPPIALTACLVLAALTGCSDREPLPEIDPDLQAELTTWLDEHGQPPQEFVVGLFAEKDVVFLGEMHRVKHDLEFAHALIPQLYHAGVHNLATEFARREDQALLDSLVLAPEWHEDLARRIQFQQFTPWGFQEYVDVHRAAWELNQALPADARKFRILGINDSPQWQYVKTAADRDDPGIMRKVWQGMGEKRWGPVILAAVERGEKVLVHCGIHHALTHYRQPRVENGEFLRFDQSPRCGNQVFEGIGGRCALVVLHSFWPGSEDYNDWPHRPADGVIDVVMQNRQGGPRPVGFSLVDSPFGEIRPENAVYKHGYENFKLSDFCDGWVYRKPLSEFEGVTAIADWINEENIEEVRTSWPNPKHRDRTAEEFNAGVARDAVGVEKWAARFE